VSYDAPGRLYVVTGNHVVDDVPGGVPPAPADPPVPVGRATPRLAVLVAVAAGLTVLSERVSFSRVIDDQPILRALDQWGRR